MSRSKVTGPFAGNYITSEFTVYAFTASVETALAVLTFPQPGRVYSIHIRTLNKGTGTLTGTKIRRAAAGNTVVTSGGTQMLSADMGALAANAQNLIEPSGTTPTLLITQRDFAKGEQLGVFGTADGGTANGSVVIVLWKPTDHALASALDD